MISQLKQFGNGKVIGNDPMSALRRGDIDNTRQLGANHTFQSMFSLRANRTMRLQRYGPWIGKQTLLYAFQFFNCSVFAFFDCFLAYHDPGSHSVFWYNHENQKGQWETPDVVKKWRETREDQDQFDKVHFLPFPCFSISLCMSFLSLSFLFSFSLSIFLSFFLSLFIEFTSKNVNEIKT
jgi:hypothetical protein